MSGAEKTALLDFVRSGGGFLGVHSATDTFYSWPDYLDLIGGYFNGHPWHQAVTIEVADPSDPLVGFLGDSCKSKTKSTKLATSTIVAATCSCASTNARWTLASLVCINGSTDGRSPEPEFTARGEYSTRRLGTRHPSGGTRATSERSQTLSFGLGEGRPSSKIRTDDSSR